MFWNFKESFYIMVVRWLNLTIYFYIYFRMKDMKSLIQYINESNITSLKNSILDIIYALPDEIEDVEQIKALRKIRSVLDTTNRQSLEEFDEILKQKRLISQNKQITDIIVNTGDFNNIVNLVKDENNLITLEDILSNNNFFH